MKNVNIDQIVFHTLRLTWTMYLSIGGKLVQVIITDVEAHSLINRMRDLNTGKNKVTYGGDGEWNIYYTFE